MLLSNPHNSLQVCVNVYVCIRMCVLQVVMIFLFQGQVRELRGKKKNIDESKYKNNFVCLFIFHPFFWIRISENACHVNKEITESLFSYHMYIGMSIYLGISIYVYGHIFQQRKSK